ncbi:hypothetical protein DEU56DRAFT_360665 [Suillus clintonianus]|uniref:uncharacterized protein n=1 Tax=Suillus clintonianus TaxID=1904413 RepID=UPI001B879AB9|nr:uncharacterized protein DEU56DRAFT_360665 [Suillus clintonianus]KAG2136717.1 hypothetical protein DEU56DRAFT_360665 [Suillus clintonianus]
MNVLPRCGYALSGIEGKLLHQFIVTSSHYALSSELIFLLLLLLHLGNLWTFAMHWRLYGFFLFLISLPFFAQHVLLLFRPPSTISHILLLVPFLFSACFPSFHDPCIPSHCIFHF